MSDLERALAAAARPEGGEAAAAARRFAAAAWERGVAAVAYASVDSPLGPLLAAVTHRGLVRLSYRGEEPGAALQELARAVSPRVLEVPAALDPVRRELDEYFAARRRRFDVAVDWSLTRGFVREVLREVARIPYGAVASYREVASRAGNPRAGRAAGNALAVNPIPIVVPCHRVVRTGGAIGGYTGGLDRKRFLLDLEGVEL